MFCNLIDFLLAEEKTRMEEETDQASQTLLFVLTLLNGTELDVTEVGSNMRLMSVGDRGLNLERNTKREEDWFERCEITASLVRSDLLDRSRGRLELSFRHL